MIFGHTRSHSFSFNSIFIIFVHVIVSGPFFLYRFALGGNKSRIGACILDGVLGIGIRT